MSTIRQEFDAPAAPHLLGSRFAPADFSVAMQGPKRTILCPFCGSEIYISWSLWERRRTRGPRGGELRKPEMLPMMVTASVDDHECLGAAEDEHLSLRQDIAMLGMRLTSWRLSGGLNAERRLAVENHIQALRRELAALDGAPSDPADDA